MEEPQVVVADGAILGWSPAWAGSSLQDGLWVIGQSVTFPSASMPGCRTEVSLPTALEL